MKLLEKRNIRIVELSEEYIDKLLYILEKAEFINSENPDTLIQIADQLYTDLSNIK